jgi:hypothetical protein
VNSADWNHSKNGASSKLGQFHLQRGLGERTSQKKLCAFTAALCSKRHATYTMALARLLECCLDIGSFPELQNFDTTLKTNAIDSTGPCRESLQSCTQSCTYRLPFHAPRNATTTHHQNKFKVNTTDFRSTSVIMSRT